MRDRDKGDQADGNQTLVFDDQAVIEEGADDNHQNADTTQMQDIAPHVFRVGAPPFQANQQRQHDLIRQHGTERHRRHDHHRGRRRHAAEKRQDGQIIAAQRQRELKNEVFQIGRIGGEMQHADQGQGHDKQIQYQQIEGEYPTRLEDIALSLIFHHRNVKLTR